MTAYYGGIDLSARDSQVCVIDAEHTRHVEQKVPNVLDDIDRLLAPYKAHLKIVVESTFNWYWLIDGLQERGYEVCLAHTLGLYMITGAKVKTDRRDAFALAKLLSAKMIPEAYIYPKAKRSVRDLVRRRARVVQMRASEYASMRRMLYRHGILEHSRYGMTRMSEEDVERWFDDPRVQLTGKYSIERIHLYTRHIKGIESEVALALKGAASYRRLMSLPGVDRILATTIYFETGDIGRFRKAKHYSSFCRLVPGISQSGRVVRRGRNPNQGNHYLKWAFNQAASYAVRYYEPIRAYFQHLLQTHHGRARKLIAYNAVAHKLGVAAYHILRDGEVYCQKKMFGAAIPSA